MSVDGRCPTADGTVPLFSASVIVPRAQLLNEIERHTEGPYVQLSINQHGYVSIVTSSLHR